MFVHKLFEDVIMYVMQSLLPVGRTTRHEMSLDPLKRMNEGTDFCPTFLLYATKAKTKRGLPSNARLRAVILGGSENQISRRHSAAKLRARYLFYYLVAERAPEGEQEMERTQCLLEIRTSHLETSSGNGMGSI